MTTPLDILVSARSLIAERKNWITGMYAQDEHGMQVDPRAPLACKFCSLGAIQRTFYLHQQRHPGKIELIDYDARRALEAQVGSISRFNDHKTHAQVLKAWDAAIATLTEEENENR